MENYDIDEFEKMWILASLEINNPSEFKKIASDDESFKKIMNLAQYKLENSRKIDGKHKEPEKNDLNYYVIPIIMEYGSKDGKANLKADLIADSDGNGLFIVSENGMIFKTGKLQGKIESMYKKYNEYIEEGIISKEEIDEMFAVKDINDAMELIDGQDFTLEKIDKMIEGRIKEHGVKIEEKDKENEQEQQENNKEKSEKEDDEEKQIDDPLVVKIAERFNCKPEEVTYRRIDDYNRVEEDTGMNLRGKRQNVASVVITRGFKEEEYLINMEDASPFRNYRGTLENPYISEAGEMTIKYRNVKGENARSLRNDEGRSYVTHLDENGNTKVMRFVNNGKVDDMSRQERERYIAESNEASEKLQEVIDIYQKDNTQENWLRVKDAMKDKVLIDNKYKALKNQREDTKEDIEETIDETIKKIPPRDERNTDDEEDDWFTRGGPRH